MRPMCASVMDEPDGAVTAHANRADVVEEDDAATQPRSAGSTKQRTTVTSEARGSLAQAER